MPFYKAKVQIGKRSFDNVNIEVSKMETLRWKYLEKIFPNCIKEISIYCKKNEINFEDIWLDNIELYEFFDQREIITIIRYSNKYDMFFSKDISWSHNCSVNNVIYFKGRMEAQVSGILNSMKKREKQILDFIQKKKINGNN